VDEFAFDLLRSGILAVKEGDVRMAQRQLERVIDLAEDRTLLADAWFWLSETSSGPDKKRAMLESSLAYDLHHARARRSLAILDGKLIPDEIIDPENLSQAQSNSPQDFAAERFICPKCGGKMTYAPDGYNLVCEYCNRHQSIKADALLEEQDFIIAMATARGHLKPTLMTTFKCQGCGADFLLAPGVISSDCTFCGSAHVVVMESLHELVEPDCIIPMVLQQEQANDQLKNWIQNNRIQTDDTPQPARGLYLPLWSFDIGGHIAWSGERMQNKKVVHINGEDIVSFNDLAIPASQPFATLLDRMLGSYDLINAPLYDNRYLAGWPAKIYEIPMVKASLDARQKASRLVERRIVSKDGVLDNLKYSTAELFVESFKLTLVPVWVSSYHLQMQKYAVLINGHSGEVQTEMPRRGLSGWLKDKLTI
jgi:DNA-directed RNA polymerase subunit RPC12/RpoP